MKKKIPVLALSVLLAFGCAASVSAADAGMAAGSKTAVNEDAAGNHIAAAAKIKIGSVKLKYKSTYFTGKALKPSVTVTAKVDGKTKTLKKGKDYTVTYSDNISVGTATVTVKGKGSYKGTKTASFKILWKEPKGVIDPVKGWKKYNKLIQEIREKKDLAARVTLMHQAEDILMSTYAVIPIYYYDKTGTYYFTFNVKSSLFSGLTPGQAANVRKAVSILIDRKKAMPERTPATTFVPVGMSDGNGGIFHKSNKNGYFNALYINKKQKTALAEARKLLMSAGYRFDSDGKLSSSTPLTIPYLYNNEGTGHSDIAKSIAADLSKIGIKLKITGMSWEALQKKWQGKFTASRGGWVSEVDDPIGMLEAFCTSENTDGNTPHFG